MTTLINIRTPYFDESKPCVGFDLDDTIATKSNILLPRVLEMLISLDKDYSIIIISNQKKMTKSKLEKRMKDLDLPFEYSAYFAIGDDEYRKPNTKILTQEQIKLGFYVGDAAGREGDHSDCDLQFAKNANVPFYTPEECFSENIQSKKNLKRVKSLRFDGVINSRFIDFNLILLVGCPASGKSTLSKQFVDYSIVSNDEFSENKKKKCFNKCKELLASDQSVIVDNLNSTKLAREPYIDLARKYHANVIIIYVNTSFQMCLLRNKNRDKKVPEVVLYKYRKCFEYPTKDEYDKLYTFV